MDALVLIAVAVVTSGASYLTWLTRKENAEQHAAGQAKTDSLIQGVGALGGKVDVVKDLVIEHINDREAHAPRS